MLPRTERSEMIVITRTPRGTVFVIITIQVGVWISWCDSTGIRVVVPREAVVVVRITIGVCSLVWAYIGPISAEVPSGRSALCLGLCQANDNSQ